MAEDKPDPFLRSLFVQKADWDPLALCAGFDGGAWRCVELARHLTEWILEFSLRTSERKLISPGNVVASLREAAARVYEKDSISRGEAGELMLHVACRQAFGTSQLLARLFYKSSLDEQVHGFDCVHFRRTSTGNVELWLGESKFYASASSAIASARKSVKEHLDRGFIKAQKTLIMPKMVDEDTSIAGEIRHLFHQNTPIDQFLDAMVIPVLIACDSKAVAGHSSASTAYNAAVYVELADISKKLKNGPPFCQIRIQPIYVPLLSKENLRKAFGDCLKGLQ